MAKKSSNKQYAKALFEVTKNLKGEMLTKVLMKFIAILVRNHKLKQSERIIKEFIKIGKKEEGIAAIEISSARKLDVEAVTKIKKIFGNKVEESESLDELLIGGVVVKTEDKIFDVSLKTQLNKFKQLLES